jgi:hypothetical protein
MYPPIFNAVNVSAVRALLKTGSAPLRFYLFGMAPQDVAYPYAVWQTVGGSPENYVNQVPDIDSFSTQIDVYATPSQGPSVARSVAEAIRDAIEPSSHVTSWRGERVDPDTKNWRVSFDADWFVPR